MRWPFRFRLLQLILRFSWFEFIVCFEVDAIQNSQSVADRRVPYSKWLSLTCGVLNLSFSLLNFKVPEIYFLKRNPENFVFSLDSIDKRPVSKRNARNSFSF